MCLLFLFFNLSVSSSLKQDTSIIDNLIKKALKQQHHNIDSAYQTLRLACTLSQKINYEKGIGSSLFLLGNIYSEKGKLDSALIYLKQSIIIRKKFNNVKSEANAADEIGSVYQKKGSKDSAFKYYYYAIKKYEQIKDSQNIATIYNEMSDLSLKYGDSRKALFFLDNSLRIFTNLKDSANIAKTNVLYGFIYYYSQKIDISLQYFLKAKALDESLNEERSLADDYNYLGLCYEALHQDKNSKQCFLQAFNYFDKFGIKHGKSEVLFNIGFYFYNRQINDSAIHYFEKANEVLKNSQEGDMKLSILNALAECNALNGNYQKAYNYHVEYSDLNDSLLNKEKVKQIAEMQTQYDTEKKNQEIILLSEQNKTEIAKRNFFIAGSLVLLLCIIVLGIYLLQRNRLAKKNELLAQEKISSILKEQEIKSYNAMIEGQEEERKGIALDLHDRIGSMLSTVKLLFSGLNDKIDKNHDDNQIQFNNATKLLDETVVEVRHISHNLSASVVNSFGLVRALQELCDSIHNSKLIRCKLIYFGLNARLEPQIEIGIFRIVQELVNNAIKHSKAKTITVQLTRTEESINLTVDDDGVGFDVESKMKSRGMGMKNIETRAAKINGTFKVDSSPGKGTISIIEIPLNYDQDFNS